MTVAAIIQQALSKGTISQDEMSKLLYLTHVQPLSSDELHLIHQLLQSLRQGQVHLQVTTRRSRSRLVVHRR